MRAEEVVDELVLAVFRDFLKDGVEQELTEEGVGVEEQLFEAVGVVPYSLLIEELSLPEHPPEGTEYVSGVVLVEPVMVEVKPCLEKLLALIGYPLQVLLIQKRYF